MGSFEKLAGYPSFFDVTVVQLSGNADDPSLLTVKGIETLDIDHLDETGQIFISSQGTKHVLVVVSNPSDPTEFLYGVADYEITIEKQH